MACERGEEDLYDVRWGEENSHPYSFPYTLCPGPPKQAGSQGPVDKGKVSVSPGDEAQ